MAETFDRRLTPARPDLAAEHLRGKVEAADYVAGRAMRIGVEVTDIRPQPAHDVGIDTQAIFGEDVTVYEEHEGWCWVQLARDGYVGYCASTDLVEPGPAPTHRVSVPRTFAYPGPSMKLPIAGALPQNAQIAVSAIQGDFARVDWLGFVMTRHLVPHDVFASDFVTIAETYLDVPYLWGGRTMLGLDCSGLVQTSLQAAGISAPRDTDMQAAALGEDLPLATQDLRRGDLVFWKGHVGIMGDAETLLHANGHHMQVAREPFAVARARILEKSFGAVTRIKRLPSTGA